jgi:voltage-gated potassium channel
MSSAEGTTHGLQTMTSSHGVLGGLLRGAARLGSRKEPNFGWLLVALIALLVIVWVPESRVLANAALTASLAIVGLASVPLLPPHGVLRWGQFALCGLAMLFVWLGPEGQERAVYAVARFSVVLFFLSVAVWTVWHLVRAERVTASTLLGAVSGYLLLGIAFAMFYATIETVAPGSLNLGVASGAGPGTAGSAPIYFSFITLTTIGYGDMTPVGELARLVVVAEGLTGQFYVAAVVARLVSLYVAHAPAPPTDS